MRRTLLTLLLLTALPARAEDLVSGISQDTIQITSNYTGTDIVVFGAIEQPQNPQGRNIVVVVRGPGTRWPLPPDDVVEFDTTSSSCVAQITCPASRARP